MVSRKYDVADDGHVFCFRDSAGNCHVVSIESILKPTHAHDSTLIQATKDLNSILDKPPKKNDEGEELAIISTSKGLVLVWVKCVDKVDESIKFVKTEEERERLIGLSS